MTSIPDRLVECRDKEDPDHKQRVMNIGIVGAHILQIDLGVRDSPVMRRVCIYEEAGPSAAAQTGNDADTAALQNPGVQEQLAPQPPGPQPEVPPADADKASVAPGADSGEATPAPHPTAAPASNPGTLELPANTSNDCALI